MRTVEEIQKEIDKLYEEMKLLKVHLPEPVEPYEGQYNSLRITVVDYIKYLWNGNAYSAIDYNRWIMEHAITAVYGSEIWGKIRSIQK